MLAPQWGGLPFVGRRPGNLQIFVNVTVYRESKSRRLRSFLARWYDETGPVDMLALQRRVAFGGAFGSSRRALKPAPDAGTVSRGFDRALQIIAQSYNVGFWCRGFKEPRFFGEPRAWLSREHHLHIWCHDSARGSDGFEEAEFLKDSESVAFPLPCPPCIH